MSQTSPITFLLNDRLITVDVPPALVALDFLRKQKQLTGSKEGCKEGDCGACTVIVGELQDGEMHYRPMTSCLLPMGELHGKHLVSIEGLNMQELSPVQAAMVDCGGTQCGYCTPGFVVAMTAGLMDPSIPLDKKGHDFATSGNLCRCTGYRSIKSAGAQAFTTLAPALENKPRIEALCQAGALPKSFLETAEQLANIGPRPTPSHQNFEYDGPPVAGGTDLFVQRGEELPDRFPELLNSRPLKPVEEQDGIIHVDARCTFEAFGRDELIRSAIPAIADYNDLIASWPIRTRATLAGNICNASPIADMTCLLLALEAELVLSGPSGESVVPLKKFYLGYKSLAKKPEDRVVEIRFPRPSPDEHLNWEKVSKRKILDIASVNSAAKIEVVDGVIKSASLALGGVAATPLYLAKTSAKLRGSNLSQETVLDAVEFAQTEFSPISDVRGSAAYKRLLARQLLLAHFTKLFPQTINEESICATLR